MAWGIEGLGDWGIGGLGDWGIGGSGDWGIGGFGDWGHFQPFLTNFDGFKLFWTVLDPIDCF